MNFLKTVLAVLLGFLLGAALSRPKAAKAAGNVYVKQVQSACITLSKARVWSGSPAPALAAMLSASLPVSEVRQSCGHRTWSRLEDTPLAAERLAPGHSRRILWAVRIMKQPFRKER